MAAKRAASEAGYTITVDDHYVLVEDRLTKDEYAALSGLPVRIDEFKLGCERYIIRLTDEEVADTVIDYLTGREKKKFRRCREKIYVR